MPTLLDLIGIEPPADDRRRRAVADRGRELRAVARRRRRAERPRHPVLRDARLPGALPRRLEGGRVPPAAVHRLRRQRRAASPSTTTCGSCTTSPRTSRRSHDLAAERAREARAELQELWWEEAERYQVLPLNNQPGRFGDRRFRRDRYEYHPGIGPLPEAHGAEPARTGRFVIAAELDVPADGAVDGVIVAHGGHAGGYALYLAGPAPALRLQLPRHRDHDGVGRASSCRRARSRRRSSSRTAGDGRVRRRAVLRRRARRRGHDPAHARPITYGMTRLRRRLPARRADLPRPGGPRRDHARRAPQGRHRGPRAAHAATPTRRSARTSPPSSPTPGFCGRSRLDAGGRERSAERGRPRRRAGSPTG